MINDNRRYTQNIVVFLLLFVVLLMSVGYASYSERLNVNGLVNVSPAVWSIKLDTSSYVESVGSVSVDSSDRTLTGTTMTYDVSLDKPGDYYEFSVKVINDGTFDANLIGITMTSLTEVQSKYLTYEISYDGNIYTTSQTGLTDLISKNNGQKVIKVRISYITPVDYNDLPQEVVTIPLSATFVYEQVA